MYNMLHCWGAWYMDIAIFKCAPVTSDAFSILYRLCQLKMFSDSFYSISCSLFPLKLAIIKFKSFRNFNFPTVHCGNCWTIKDRVYACCVLLLKSITGNLQTQTACTNKCVWMQFNKTCRLQSYGYIETEKTFICWFLNNFFFF